MATTKKTVERAAEWVAPQALVPWPDNPRRNASAVGEVAKSIQAYGFAAPIVARRANREIIAGHTRHEAALRLGLTKVPVRYLDVSEEDAHRLAIADNATGEIAAWDSGGLERLLADLGANIPGTSTSQAEPLELRALLASIEEPDEAEDEDPIEGPIQSEEGRVYRLGRHTLTYGSSLGVVAAEAAGMFFDPPFDCDYSQWVPLAPTIVVWMGYGNGSAYDWIGRRIAEGYAAHEVVFTGGWHGPRVETRPMLLHQTITVLSKVPRLDLRTIKLSGADTVPDGRHKSWQQGDGGSVQQHLGTGLAMGKSVKQMLVAAAYVEPGGLVIDPCAGSGSGLLACERSGRTWHGWETNGAHVDLARRRWAKEASRSGFDLGPDGLQD